MTSIIRKGMSAYLLAAGVIISSCNGQGSAANGRFLDRPDAQKEAGSTLAGQAAFSGIGDRIRCMLQDKAGDYWFGSDGAGLYRYDGKTLMQFSRKDGLCSDVVFGIQEGVAGDLWLETDQGLCRYDGKRFVNYADTLRLSDRHGLVYKTGDLLFNDGGVAYHFNGRSFSTFTIHPASYKPAASNLDRPYGFYCVYEDRAGNVWFGTDGKGVCKYDGNSFTYFADQGLGGGAVRTIFQDKDGIMWFGNNGHGLFCYDGIKLRNMTAEHDLGNPDFLAKKVTSATTPNMARVWSLNEDRAGRLWIGTIDAGVWCLEGEKLTNYTVRDGLGTNAVIAIYRDHKDDLWFITEGAGVYKFDQQRFVRVAI